MIFTYIYDIYIYIYIYISYIYIYIYIYVQREREREMQDIGAAVGRGSRQRDITCLFLSSRVEVDPKVHGPHRKQ